MCHNLSSSPLSLVTLPGALPLHPSSLGFASCSCMHTSRSVVLVVALTRTNTPHAVSLPRFSLEPLHLWAAHLYPHVQLLFYMRALRLKARTYFLVYTVLVTRSFPACLAYFLKPSCLQVSSMKCGGCSAAVKRMLMTRPEVAAAAVNLLTETAAVQVRWDGAAHG